MSNQALWQAINWFSTPAFAVLVLILVYRRLYRSFPFFFAFVFLSLLGDVARFMALPTKTRGYLYAYWISHLVTTVFTLLATYELFVRRLFPGFHKINLYRWIFLSAALVIVSLGALLVVGSFKVSVLIDILNVLDLFRVALLIFF